MTFLYKSAEENIICTKVIVYKGLKGVHMYSTTAIVIEVIVNIWQKQTNIIVDIK